MESNKIKIVKELLQNEIDGDVKSAYEKLHSDYTMTWMLKTRKGDLFPKEKVTNPNDLKEVYVIKNRKYDIKNFAENENFVFVEMIESYPDPKTNKLYITPLVLVLEFKDGKVIRGRHYCDNDVSFSDFEKETLEKVYK